jgi:hypothetical protein
MESAFTPGVFNSFRQADLNCGDYMVRSTLMTLLGQFSCYSGNLRALGPDLEFRLLSFAQAGGSAGRHGTAGEASSDNSYPGFFTPGVSQLF